MNGLSTQTIFLILGVCVAIACGAFIAGLYLTRKSRTDAQKDIEAGMAELDKVIPAAKTRIEKLDQRVIDSFQPLSAAGQENFSLVKQFVQLMDSRRDRLQELISNNRLEDMFRAQKIVNHPLENAGDHLTSVVFANTVLHLEPGQFEVAVDTMLTAVEEELAGSGSVGYKRARETFSARRRKFTIRGFIQSVTGTPEDK